MPLACLIVASDGKIGHRRQAEAIALRLGLPAQILSNSAPIEALQAAAQNAAVVIGAGRQSIRPMRALAASEHPPFLVLLQPVVHRPGDFDLIWAPAHDRAGFKILRRTQLIETLTAPAALNPDDINNAATWLKDHCPPRSGPVVGVLIGGPSRAHRFGNPEVDELAARLSAFAETHGATLLLTTSRRTPKGAAQRIAARLPEGRHLVFDAQHPKKLPAETVYAGILGLAQTLIVTCDSVAMLSEAAFTGKPIYGWRLPGGRGKFERFFAGLEAHGALRWFDGGLNAWSYPPLDAAESVASAIRTRLDFTSQHPRRM